MAKLVAPANEQIIQNGITFDVEYKLTQSRERDWAPYDRIMAIIYDDAHMVVTIRESNTTKSIKDAVKIEALKGLTRNEASFEILARRSQQNLF